MQTQHRMVLQQLAMVLVFVALSPLWAKADLDHSGLTLIEQQTNNPILTESVTPTTGYPWTWDVSNLSGFDGTPTFWFEYENADHTSASLHWSGVATTDWQAGVDGGFTLTLSNGVDGDRNYSMSLSLRSMVGGGYTMFEQQTGGSDGITAAGAEGFVVIRTGSTGVPGDLSLAFNAMGAVIACSSTAASWTEDGTINLAIVDGSRPASNVIGWPVSLRSMVGGGYTVTFQPNLDTGV